jgi:capsular exopolysaccharide synthesis family protein
MDLEQYLRAVRKVWWVIAVATLLGAAYGAHTASRTVPEYRASVTFFVVTRSADASVSAAVQGDQFAQRRVNSYVALLSTDRLAQMVADHPDVDLPPQQIRRMLGASGDLDTVLFTATAMSPSRDLAQRVAGAVATEFVTLVDEVEGQGNDEGSVHLEVVSGPSVSQVPTRPLLTTAIPAAVGLLLGLALALLLELRDQTLRSDDQLRALGTVPVLGRIPFDRRVPSELVAVVDGSSSFAEAFRQVRTNLQFLDVQHPLQLLVVTSSLADEGKSVTSANIALSLIRTGHPTLVIEADLRRPKVADVFGVDRSTGLTDVLAGRASVDEALFATASPDLVVMPTGQLPPNPVELLGSDAMHRLVDELRTRFEVIVIDTPPLLPVTDAAVVAAHADGVVLVVRAGRATRHQVEQSMRALSAVGANLVGFVMTWVQPGHGSGYDAYGQYTSAPGVRRKIWARVTSLLGVAGDAGVAASRPRRRPSGAGPDGGRPPGGSARAGAEFGTEPGDRAPRKGPPNGGQSGGRSDPAGGPLPADKGDGDRRPARSAASTPPSAPPAVQGGEERPRHGRRPSWEQLHPEERVGGGPIPGTEAERPGSPEAPERVDEPATSRWRSGEVVDPPES